MAFTPEQEQKIQELLGAYERGKSIADLPTLSTTKEDAINLLVEVLKDGESYSAHVADILPWIEDEVAYGVRWQSHQDDPTLERIGNLALHKSLPVQSLMKGCLVADDGTVNEYLDPTDWTRNTLDGSRGQVMVEIPRYYRKFTTEVAPTSGTKTFSVMLSLYPLPGYHVVPKCYVGAFEGVLDRTNGTTAKEMKLCSVNNTTPAFRGGTPSASDATDDRLLGVASSGNVWNDYRTTARNRGEAGRNGAGWNAYPYEVHKNIYWLFCVEYATRNCQLSYKADKTSEGYAQGGLGFGVYLKDWDKYNKKRPFIPCALNAKYGNQSSVVTYTVEVPDTGAVDVSVPAYRGIQNLWGHIIKFSDGAALRVYSDTGDNQVSELYTTDDPTLYNGDNADGFKFVGLARRKDGFFDDFIFGEDGEIIASVDAEDANANTGHCDSQYLCNFNTIKREYAHRALSFGGFSASGSSAGLACVSASYPFSNSSSNFGSRLCLLT